MSDMSQFVKTLFGASAIGFATASLGAAPAVAASFEGQWSVVVTPENGGCEGPYVLPIKVVESRIIYIGKGQLEADGGVQPNGTVQVSFLSKGDRLDARGKMSNDRYGIGSWRSPTEKCDGTWIARKESKVLNRAAGQESLGPDCRNARSIVVVVDGLVHLYRLVERNLCGPDR
jgi:hypothetical protein